MVCSDVKHTLTAHINGSYMRNILSIIDRESMLMFCFVFTQWRYIINYEPLRWMCLIELMWVNLYGLKNQNMLPSLFSTHKHTDTELESTQRSTTKASSDRYHSFVSKIELEFSVFCAVLLHCCCCCLAR